MLFLFLVMNVESIIHQFLTDLAVTTWYEYLAVAAGILSVWYSKKENILVYPVGLVNTIIYVFISLRGHLPGEATVNFYYTVMSLIGWYGWSQKDNRQQPIIHIQFSTKQEWAQQLLFFGIVYTVLYYSLQYFKAGFFPGSIPWADALASSAAFAGMWMMTRKKVESWYWWMLTNVVSIPLYFVKHYVFTSVYYFILLCLSVAGLMEWIGKARPSNDER